MTLTRSPTKVASETSRISENSVNVQTNTSASIIKPSNFRPMESTVSTTPQTPFTPPITPTAESATNNFIAEQLALMNRKLDKIDSLESIITSSFATQNDRLDDLEKENASLAQKAMEQDKVIDDLWIALYAKNLIFHGIKDSEDEDQQKLFNNICILIITHIKMDIKPDVVYRKGRYSSSSCRPVRVSFQKQSDKNCVFEQRHLFPSDISIKSDLPKTVRVENAILLKKKGELEGMDMQCTMNYRLRQLSTASGDIFKVENGNLTRTQRSADHRPHQSTSHNFNGSKNGQGKRKHRSPDPAFINAGNLRSAACKKGRTIDNTTPNQQFQEASHNPVFNPEAATISDSDMST